LSADVLPLQFNGVHDTEAIDISPETLFLSALKNTSALDDLEPPYHVRTSRAPVPDLPQVRSNLGLDDENLWEQAYPCLFPYGLGGMEKKSRLTPISLSQHVRWALQYHDKRFRKHHSFPFFAFGILQRRQTLSSSRLQMTRHNFASLAPLLSTITVEQLVVAAKEELENRPITNPAIRHLKQQIRATSSRVMGSDAARTSCRKEIWSTNITLGPPSIWITINPDDLNDPIAQVLAGAEIDLNCFDKNSGPSSSLRAQTIAQDPYAAAHFFTFLIRAIICSLFQIRVSGGHRIESDLGIYGNVSAYFGTVESQGRGTLHLHMLLWLVGNPSPDRMKELLRLPEFREKVSRYIASTFHASHPNLNTAASANLIPVNAHVAYSRSPNPDAPNYDLEFARLELDVIRSKHIHKCTLAQCLKLDKANRPVCKRRAPWPLSPVPIIHENGNWLPERHYSYLNIWTPAIAVATRANSDAKLLTNSRDSCNVTWYTAKYAAKPQGRTHNSSALLAQRLAYHIDSTDHLDNLLERQRLLIFRSANILNHEQEISAPMIMLHLMGWPDVYRSHNYAPLYWSSFLSLIFEQYPGLRTASS
jgi:hypothetical protein